MEASKNLFSKVRACCRVEYDKVTLLCYTMATISVKHANYVSLFDQFKEIGIPPSDITVVTYGPVPIGAHVQSNPVCRTGSAILEDIGNRNIEEPLLKALALECYARVSVNGLSCGRNTVKQL
ncbi:Uncharacterized protein APZ42_029818 [Daphnia magna]|uniref:Uncharacterized protein n=1 Tax=Daphnia magna TaxID=35525 RepID=A0A162D494_9CRUS|nr:Uncharacterized protein APZ42_029818 [Daphnia magna]